MFVFLTATLFIYFATTVSKINCTTDNYILCIVYTTILQYNKFFKYIQSNRTHFKEWGGSGNSSLLTWIYAGWRSKLTGTGNCFLKSVMWKSRNARGTFCRFTSVCQVRLNAMPPNTTLDPTPTPLNIMLNNNL